LQPHLVSYGFATHIESLMKYDYIYNIRLSAKVGLKPTAHQMRLQTAFSVHANLRQREKHGDSAL